MRGKVECWTPRAEAVTPEQIKDRLAEFGRWCLGEMRYPAPGDIDGGAAQDQAEALGLLERVTVEEPCGEDCSCAEFHGDPPWECLREAEGVRAPNPVLTQEEG